MGQERAEEKTRLNCGGTCSIAVRNTVVSPWFDLGLACLYIRLRAVVAEKREKIPVLRCASDKGGAGCVCRWPLDLVNGRGDAHSQILNSSFKKSFVRPHTPTTYTGLSMHVTRT